MKTQRHTGSMSGDMAAAVGVTLTEPRQAAIAVTPGAERPAWGRVPSAGLQWEHGLAGTLSLDFGSPELRGNQYLWSHRPGRGPLQY